MRFMVCTAIAGLVLVAGPSARAQGNTRTLVTVWAHADDEGPVAPILARYAREGVQVQMIIATDGAQGAANTSVPRGPATSQNQPLRLLWDPVATRSCPKYVDKLRTVEAASTRQQPVSVQRV